MRSTVLAATIATGLLFTPNALSAHRPAAEPGGTAEATVRHLVTGEPLAGMPVFVEQIGGPENDSGVQVFRTDRDGRAYMTSLSTGDYAAWVQWNNNRSDPVEFFINEDTDVVVRFTIFFNPDIDGAAR